MEKEEIKEKAETEKPEKDTKKDSETEEKEDSKDSEKVEEKKPDTDKKDKDEGKDKTSKKESDTEKEKKDEKSEKKESESKEKSTDKKSEEEDQDSKKDKKEEKADEGKDKEEDKDSEKDSEKSDDKKETGKKSRKKRGRRRYGKEPAPWAPKTKLGKKVKAGKIKKIDDILEENQKILEPEIVDKLIDPDSDLIYIGQSKGKFGGGKRRVWRQTQRKTGEGNVPTFSAMAVVGDKNSHVGIGMGESKETLPARDKAIRKAKLNIFKVIRGDGSFDSVGKGNSSIPFKVKGKAGSVKVQLIPAAPGTGLVVADELKKILELAGIEDIYSKTFGNKRTTFNLIKACIDALKKTNLKRREFRK